VRKAEGITCPPTASGAQTPSGPQPTVASNVAVAVILVRRRPSACPIGSPRRPSSASSRGGRRHGDRTRLATVAAVPVHVPHVEMPLDRLRELIDGGVLDREDQEELTGQPLPLGPASASLRSPDPSRRDCSFGTGEELSSEPRRSCRHVAACVPEQSCPDAWIAFRGFCSVGKGSLSSVASHSSCSSHLGVSESAVGRPPPASDAGPAVFPSHLACRGSTRTGVPGPLFDRDDH
jgi:hypothetical protein